MFSLTCAKNAKNSISDLSCHFRSLRGPAPRYPKVQKVNPDLTCARTSGFFEYLVFPRDLKLVIQIRKKYWDLEICRKS